MTPEERDRVAELFDRLETLENSPRDRDATYAINEGLERAPNAIYALVQTALVQDEALRAAGERIRALEAELGYEKPPQSDGSFLDNVRDAILGREEPPRRGGSVPSVRSPDAPMGTPAGFRTGGQTGDRYSHHGDQQGSGGSFLGTAAAAAAGVVGGALLAQSLKGLLGSSGDGRAQSAHDAPSGGGSPWGDPSSGSGNLAREAGLDDIGPGVGRHGAFDTAEADSDFDDGGDFDLGDIA